MFFSLFMKFLSAFSLTVLMHLKNHKNFITDRNQSVTNLS